MKQVDQPLSEIVEKHTGEGGVLKGLPNAARQWIAFHAFYDNETEFVANHANEIITSLATAAAVKIDAEFNRCCEKSPIDIGDFKEVRDAGYAEIGRAFLHTPDHDKIIRALDEILGGV